MFRVFVIGVSLVGGCALGASAQQARGLDPAGFRVTLGGQLDSAALREVSGMAASRRRDDLLWVHNDSGRGPFLYPISLSGERLGRLRLSRATSRDWEDMASFVYDGKPMLLVADVGDNRAQRRHSWLHVIEEPVVPEGGLPKDAQATVAWSVPFRYPEGAADCEAVAVDVASDRVLLLSKRQRPPRLYSVPIRPPRAKPAAGRLIDAKFLGTVASIPGPTAQDIVQDPMSIAYHSQPTAMDLAGNQLLVLTYGHAYLFEREAKASWSEAITAKPDIILLPSMRQGESLAFDRPGVHAYVTSEKRPAPLYRLVRETTPAKGE